MNSPFQSSGCQAFYDHWRRLSGDAMLPHTRTYFDHPTPLMRCSFIFELVPEGSLVRLMGTELVARWQQNVTGEYLESHMVPSDAKRLSSDLKTVCAHPVGATGVGEAKTSTNRPLGFEAVILPLAVDAGKPPRCVVYRECHGELDFHERKVGFYWPQNRAWIDLGAGMPAEMPSN